MGPTITLERVSYRYPRQPRLAVRRASLTLRPGSIVAIIGPNGAGKTTLLAIAGLLLEPNEGRVLIDGRTARGDPWKHRVVFVPERPVLLRGSLLWNIMLAPRLLGLPRGEAEEQALRAAERLGLEDLLDKPARSLSRGQKTLAQIARALASGARALLLDEPYATLDPEARRRLTSTLREEARKGATIAFTSHESILVETVADTAILLIDGEVRVQGNPRQVLEEYLSG